MDYTGPREVSVLEPIGGAIEKTREILFQPFDIGKWFVIGFCAWLSVLGQGGGSNGGGFDGGGGGGNIQQELQHAKNEIVQHLHIIIPVALTIAVIVIIAAVVFIWLRSRGEFMFLHCVGWNVAEVATPWRYYADQGNSLFLFNLSLGFLGAALGLVFIIPVIIILIPWIKSDFEYFPTGQIVSISLLVIGFILSMIIIGYIKTITRDFVVPIMYLRRCRVSDAWREFGNLFAVNKKPFILFLLFLIIVNLVLWALLVGAGLITCCCGFILFMIPYIGTVAKLPIHVWRRAYSALFLAQFGPEYDVFPKPIPYAPTDSVSSGLPVSPEMNWPPQPPIPPRDYY